MKTYYYLKGNIDNNTASNLEPGAPATHDDKQIGTVTNLRFEKGNLIAEMKISDKEFATIIAKTKSR